ncbi:DUF86 domain-containing protein [Methanobacterium sp. MBAC-LM]|uniref:HepT-like ribonuclease domain-containing protein n=1 Tax=Methanobacterium sp. MBAC-LM TaxID=3412034 RepID=UPI003C78562B
MNRDKFFLDHVFDEITFLNDYFSDLKFDDLKNDPVLQKALLKSLENIGEAVKNISTDFKSKNPDIEWRKIAGLRDKLIHHYFGVDWDLVWDVIENT